MLKAIDGEGEGSAPSLARALHVPFAGFVQYVLQPEDREQVVNVTGSSGFDAHTYDHVLTEAGIVRARQALAQNQYVGPASH